MKIFYLFILVLVISFLSIPDQAFSGATAGDGMIESSEISINFDNSGFVNGEGIVISQDVNIEDAIGIFNDINEGTIEPNELVITFNYPTNLPSQNIVLDNGVETADGVWIDVNGNTIVEGGEITIIRSDKFPDGGILIVGTINPIILAAASFLDNPKLEDGEIIINNNGAGFIDGTVSLLGQNSSSLGFATFTDGPIEVYSVPTLGDWIVTSDCTLFTNATASGNVLVQNNSQVIISNGVSLDINFTDFNLRIIFGSVSIEAGGKII